MTWRLDARMPWHGPTRTEPLLTREWLVTNGLGGYASGTVAGVATRRYHGLLIAALPAPLGRHDDAQPPARAAAPARRHQSSASAARSASAAPANCTAPSTSSSSASKPACRSGATRSTASSSRSGSCCRTARTRSTSPIGWSQGDGHGAARAAAVGPFPPHDAPVSDAARRPYTPHGRRRPLRDRPAAARLPPLRLLLHGQRRGVHARRQDDRRQSSTASRGSRGYDSAGDLWSPGYFRVDLAPGSDATLVASTEPWETILALAARRGLRGRAASAARRLLADGRRRRRASGSAAELVLAADQFLITPAGRVEDAARARAAGDEVRTVIAGYHWFTDWGRDTMISLEGLTLATGRHAEAGYILRTFAHYVRDGLIPNLFPEGEKRGPLPHRRRHALVLPRRSTATSQPPATATRSRLLLPQAARHRRPSPRAARASASASIPRDGLLRQGAEGYQLTWMDAKVGDWVVTPRRGKAVEINALWYNALRLLEGWVREAGRRSRRRAIGRARRAGAGSRSTSASGTTRAAICTTWSTARQGDDPPAGRTRSSPSRCDHPVLDRDALGAGARTWCASGC